MAVRAALVAFALATACGGSEPLSVVPPVRCSSDSCVDAVGQAICWEITSVRCCSLEGGGESCRASGAWTTCLGPDASAETVGSGPCSPLPN